MLGFLRMVIGIKVSVGLAVVAGLLVTGWLRLRREHATWGVDAADIGRSLAGDDLVADADIVETRSLDVDAPPSAVWPWLVQMGYGRGGWYSYDQLDMRGPSARAIDPELQHLAEGDIVPTHPGGGFLARLVDEPRALVLYLDSQIAKEQMAAAARSGERSESMPAGLQMAGSMGDLTMPDFRVSWAFVLEETPRGGTHFIERFRVRTGEAGLPQRLGMPFMGFGVFVMTRKQMLGIKSRAEGAWRPRASERGAASVPSDEPAPASSETEAPSSPDA